jgi:hypothetical protein
MRAVSKSGRERSGARAVTETERVLAAAIPFVLDYSRVRIYEAGSSGGAAKVRRLVLRASRNRAVALGNHVFLPDSCTGDLGVLAHELTHCGQYQRWGALRYFARGVATQLRHALHQGFGIGSNPYDYRIEPGKPFNSYGMEQQAQMVEDRFRGRAFDHAIPSA